MGSRQHNFYNAAFRRAGYDGACEEIQQLWLDGKRDEAIARLLAGEDSYRRTFDGSLLGMSRGGGQEEASIQLAGGRGTAFSIDVWR